MTGKKRKKAADGKIPYEVLDRELKEAKDLIDAIRTGKVDVVRGTSDDNAILKLERLELVEERKRLLHKLQESNESLLDEIKVRKEAETNLQSALVRAEEATLLKDKFVSLVSHDLRTPLSSMFGYIDLVLQRNSDVLDKEAITILKAAVSTTQRMDRLIEELLEVGRIKSGVLDLKYSFVNVYFLVVNALSGLEDLAARKGIMLINKIPGKMFAYVDEALFSQVIYNLIYNAIKFCNRGDCITVSSIPGDKLSVAVTDTGIGISPELLDNLFDYAKATSKVGTDGEIGTGLGLPLCKEIVDAHRGELLVESEPGEGSVFTITLESLRPRILIVDDEIESVNHTSEILSVIDADIITAHDGKEALDTIYKTPPHLILLDIFMPGIDGFEFLERIKNTKDYNEIPIIVLSITGDMNNREKALRSGANDFVVKANLKDELLQRAGKYIGYRTHEIRSKSPKKRSDENTKQVLIVEDDETLVEALGEFFAEDGYSMISASDEQSAISLYSAHKSTLDAIIVDLRLPGVNGIELAKHNFENAFLPLVIFTSKADAKLALELLSFGVKDYLVKPVDSDYLLRVVDNAIHRHSKLSGSEGTEEYEGNVNSLTIPSKVAGIQRAQNWLQRKVRATFNDNESHRFLNYVEEFLLNAHEHGNLGLTAEDKAELLTRGLFDNEVEARENESSAKINIAISVLKSEVAISITDEGPGFEFSDYLNMNEEDIINRLNMPCGRGIMISQRYFDSIEYSKGGASVLLIKNLCNT